jgi:hypothetical protein
MTVKELEQRVRLLEEQVRELQRDRASGTAGRDFDWEKTVDKFKNDEHILAVLSEAMKSREQERQAVRRKSSKRASR